MRNPDCGHAGILYDALIELGEILGDEADGDVGSQKIQILSPAFEDDDRVAVLGADRGTVAGGGDGFGEIEDYSNGLPVADAHAEKTVEHVEHGVGIAREA